MKNLRISAILLTLAGAFQLLAPSVVRACFVCFGGEDNDWTGAFVEPSPGKNNSRSHNSDVLEDYDCVTSKKMII